MLKWNAKELFNTLTKETNFFELRELWKAMIAFEAGAGEYTDSLDKELENIYMKADYILDKELLNKVCEAISYEN